MEKVPEAGYRIEGLTVAGFQRRLTYKNLSFPFKLGSSLYRAWSLVRNFKPHVAVGTGGYASGPVLRVAQRLGVPSVLQEQNSFPGVTNRLLGRQANVICVAFEGMERWFDPGKLVLTGNPIRESIAKSTMTRGEGLAEFGLNPALPVLFITGGSLGARVINEAIAQGLPKLLDAGLQIIWQTGASYHSQYVKYSSDRVLVLDFVRHMEAAYAASDLIVSRAGGTISELCIVGKPCILLPSPNVAEDHQTKNVEALVEKDAAVLVRDRDAAEQLLPAILDLLGDERRREDISRRIRQLARPDATRHIADEIFKLLDAREPVNKPGRAAP